MSLILDGTAGVTGPATKVIVGTTTNDSAAAGYVGESITASVTAQTVTSTAGNLTSVSLTAGDWDISAVMSCATTGANVWVKFGISQTSATFTGSDAKDYVWVWCGTGVVCSGGIPGLRVSLSSTTTLYLVVQTSSVNNGNTSGYLSARRVR